jgi:hypothetical protein
VFYILLRLCSFIKYIYPLFFRLDTPCNHLHFYVASFLPSLIFYICWVNFFNSDIVQFIIEFLFFIIPCWDNPPVHSLRLHISLSSQTLLQLHHGPYVLNHYQNCHFLLTLFKITGHAFFPARKSKYLFNCIFNIKHNTLWGVWNVIFFKNMFNSFLWWTTNLLVVALDHFYIFSLFYCLYIYSYVYTLLFLILLWLGPSII